MLETIIFLIALIAVIYVLVWSIRNDDIPDDEPTEGFFSMTHEKPGQDSDDQIS